MLLALLLFQAAHAGRFSDFCQRYLVDTDPHQFESVDTEWLGRRIEFLEIRRNWRALDRIEAEELSLMQRELELRAKLELL